MIPAERHEQALLALHRVLIEARTMGYEGASSARIADVLDWAELLPVHLMAEPDRTEDFRSALVALIAKEPRFRHALATFDGPRPELRRRKVTA